MHAHSSEGEILTHPSVTVHLLPGHAEPGILGGSVAIVVDALRASVTVAAALAAGAEAVHPVLSVEDARVLAGVLAARNEAGVLLGGERKGVRLPGFDLGNSPSEYSPKRVGGRTLVFTTTNGTRALLHARQATRILVGSLTNLRAVCSAAGSAGAPVHILCAGTDGLVSAEDALTAGALVERLCASGLPIGADDCARLCLSAWREAASRGEGGVLEAFRRSVGGRNLCDLGMDADVELCARPDSIPVVPVFDVAAGVLRL